MFIMDFKKGEILKDFDVLYKDYMNIELCILYFVAVIVVGVILGVLIAKHDKKRK